MYVRHDWKYGNRFSFGGLFPFYFRAKPPIACFPLREALNTCRLSQMLHLKATLPNTSTPSSMAVYMPLVGSKSLSSVDETLIQGCVLGDLPHFFLTAGALNLLVRVLQCLRATYIMSLSWVLTNLSWRKGGLNMGDLNNTAGSQAVICRRPHGSEPLCCAQVRSHRL